MTKGFLAKIDFHSGFVAHVEDSLDDAISTDEQIELLREDLLQVSFDNNRVTLDIGWYPSFAKHGVFRGVVVEARKWDKPLASFETGDITQLKAKVNTMIQVILGLL